MPKEIKEDLNEIEKNIKKVKKNNKKKKNTNEEAILRFRIIDLEKEQKEVKNNLDDLEKQLKSDSKDRQNLLKEANAHMDKYSNQLVDYKNEIEALKLKELVYKNQERELNEYIELFNTKSEEHIEEVNKLNEEILSLRKKVLSNDTILANLKAMVSIFIKKYGIDEVSSLTGIEKDNIEKYLQD